MDITYFCNGQAKTSTHIGGRFTTGDVVFASAADEDESGCACEGGAPNVVVGTPNIGTDISVPLELNCAVPTLRLRV